MSEQSNGCGMTTISWLECKSYIMAISVCDILSSLSFLFIFNMLVPVILVGKEVVLVMNLQKRPKSINFFFLFFWIFALSLVFPAQNKHDIRLSGLLWLLSTGDLVLERRRGGLSSFLHWLYLIAGKNLLLLYIGPVFSDSTLMKTHGTIEGQNRH